MYCILRAIIQSKRIARIYFYFFFFILNLQYVVSEIVQHCAVSKVMGRILRTKFVIFYILFAPYFKSKNSCGILFQKSVNDNIFWKIVASIKYESIIRCNFDNITQMAVESILFYEKKMCQK